MKRQSQLDIYQHSLALLTDLYQITMSYGYWKSGFDRKEAVFHLAFRRNPFQGGFSVAAGLEAVVDYLQRFHFDEEDLSYLRALKNVDGSALFCQEFITYLGNMTFTCHVDAIPEGTIVFPQEPLLRIQGPLIQCQLLESPLLNLINFPTLVATKATRICMAAKGDSVVEFGLRRAQGINGALTASRSAFIGGCDSTSNVLAGKLFGIPVKGTHSHSWVMAFDEELESFQAYAENLPDNCIFLVDTYDTIEGVKKAIEVGKWLKARGKKFLGIRLDSGDLAYLSIKSRKLLDEAGFHDSFIVASNELDETIIAELKQQGAQINVWGVGTNLVTARDQPALDGVYKISAIRDPGGPWKYKLKLSEQMIKISNPGILQVKRFYNRKGNVADAIYDINSPVTSDWEIIDPLDPTKKKTVRMGLQSRDLLEPIFRNGQLVYNLPSLKDIQIKVQSELAHFDVGIKRFLNPHQYIVGMENSLYKVKIDLINNIRSKSVRSYISPDEATQDL